MGLSDGLEGSKVIFPVCLRKVVNWGSWGQGCGNTTLGLLW